MAEQQQSFTPGPWVVDYSDGRGGNIIAPSGPVASTRWFGVTHKQVMEDYANARLIAAAPALFEALEAINRLTSPGCRTFDEAIRDMGYACDTARAALATAQAAK